MKAYATQSSRDAALTTLHARWATTTDTGRRVAQRIAAVMIEGFDRHYRLFRETSAAGEAPLRGRAPGRRRSRRCGSASASTTSGSRSASSACASELDAGSLDDAIWRSAKLLYIGLLVDHKRPELAETFFNSVVTRVLQRTYVHNDFASCARRSRPSTSSPTRRSTAATTPTSAACGRRCSRSSPTSAGAGRSRTSSATSTSSCARSLEHFGGELPAPEPDHQLQVLGSAFYRNKAAYVIGKIVNGDAETAVRRSGAPRRGRPPRARHGAVRRREHLVLFSLSRAYFMVDMDVPSGYIHFLQTLMPSKPRSELYTAVGLAEAGQDAVRPRPAPPPAPLPGPLRRGAGHARLVMHVFNLPSYPYVFKVIKDEFGHASTPTARP